MRINLPIPKSPYSVMSIAKDDTTLQSLQAEGLPTLYINGNEMSLYPSGIDIKINRILSKQLEMLNNYDVIEIDDNGIAAQCYEANSKDNAIITTGKCNSNCVMCPSSEQSRRNGSSASIEHLLEIVRHIPSDALHITITGGEPFLIGKEIFLLLSELKQRLPNTDFLLLSNGRIFCKAEYCRMLESAVPDHTIMGIPLHGFDSKSHDAITKAPGSFLQTYYGLKNLLKGDIPIELRIVISKLTVESILKIAQLIIADFPAVFSVKILGLEMLGNAAINESQVWLPYSKAFHSARNAIDLLIENGINVGLYNFPLCCVDKEYWPICFCSITDYKIKYTTNCEKCAVKDACGGIFAGTFRLAKYDAFPIEQE